MYTIFPNHPWLIFQRCGNGRVGDVYIVEERQERLRKFGAKVVILSAFERRKGVQDPCTTEHSLQMQCNHVSLVLASSPSIIFIVGCVVPCYRNEGYTLRTTSNK